MFGNKREKLRERERDVSHHRGRDVMASGDSGSNVSLSLSLSFSLLSKRVSKNCGILNYTCISHVYSISKSILVY